MPRVLIVDEDLASRKLARTVLEHMGWDAKEFSDAASALACFREQPIDAVLIGGLPGYGGLDVCRTMRQAQNGPLRIVAYTAAAQGEQTADLLAWGFDDVLFKPVTISEIQAAFNRS